MDALRKAEQEKKAAARKLRDSHIGETGDRQSDQGKLSLEPRGDISPEQLADESFIRLDEDAMEGRETASGSETERTEHAVGPGEQETGSDPAGEAAVDWSADDVPHDAGLSVDSGEAEETTIAATDYDPSKLDIDLTTDDESAGVSSELTLETDDTERARTQEYEPGPRPGSSIAAAGIDRDEDTGEIPEPDRKPDDTLAEDAHPEQLATQDDREAAGRTSGRRTPRGSGRSASYASEVTDTPATAQHIFTARRTGSGATVTVVVLLLLMITGLTASGIFYYYSVSPRVHDVVSPRAALDLDAGGRNAEAGWSAEHIVAEANSRLAESSETVATLPEPLSIDPPVNEASEKTAGADPSRESAGEPRQPVSDDLAGMENRTASGDEPGQSPRRPDQDTALELRPALMQISRSQGSAGVAQAVKDAYRAYGEGNLSRARQLYHSVLEDNPGERNALLGLAAIAVKSDDPETAYRYYARILRENPADSAARTGLLSLQEQTDPALSESRLKQMLATQPDAAYLYQALGHVHARSRRWPQAQQAYFEAYSRESRNPDYAFNLAVSLDHMGQAKTALEYYEKAMQLASGKPTGFSMSALQTRVDAIRNSVVEP